MIISTTASAITINNILEAEQRLINEQANLSIGSAGHQPRLGWMENGGQHGQLLFVGLELFLLILVSEKTSDRN